MVRAAFFHAKEKKLWFNTILKYKLWILNILLYINQQSNMQGVHVEAIISYWGS